ncbi:hypothetical protein [Bacillus sp. SM2101]|uniref:hypothetical protein n=1 Tax=Bacillus sp. SM2101 TaxID=2805366 RepID=UPI001BDEEC6E|nr:hypothetical protein [Bacillus sp. SM2101]
MEIQERFSLCFNELSKQFSQDQKFMLSFNNNFEHYRERFFDVIKSRPERKEFTQAFFEYFQELFLHGYFLVDQYISSDKTEILNGFLNQPNGIIKENLYDILNDNQSMDEFVSNEKTITFESNLLDGYENLDKILFSVKLDIIMLGALHRFLQERKSRNLNINEEPKNLRGLLYRTDDLFFVTPDKYLTCKYSDSHSELWTLHHWATQKKIKAEVGSLTLQHFSIQSLSKMLETLPSVKESENSFENIDGIYIITLTIEENISDWELSNICTRMVKSITKRNNIQDAQNIHVRASVAEAMRVFSLG